jgi:hypothetical protein
LQVCRINDVNDQQAKWRIRDELDIETRAVSLITEPRYADEIITRGTPTWFSLLHEKEEQTHRDLSFADTSRNIRARSLYFDGTPKVLELSLVRLIVTASGRRNTKAT